MVQPVQRAGEEVNPRKLLTQCERPWRVKRATCENRLVSLVYLVYLVCLVELDQPDEQNKPDKPD
jgi:hypothetical protein